MKPSMRARVRAYLERRRALGFKLLVEGRMLEAFARFSDRRGHRGPLTKEVAIRWAALPRGSDRLYRARRLEVVRTFARHQSALEPGTQIPPRHRFGPAHRRPHPHRFSPEEIEELMRRATRLAGSLRPHTFRTLIGLLACTGLRVSEALRLKVAEVDFTERVLTIRESKYRKTRLVPLHPTAAVALQRYHDRRRRLFPLTETFFVNEAGAPLPLSTADHTFASLRTGIGQGERPPRLSDCRHYFTSQVLLRWQRSAKGAAHRVAILSRYLGHSHVTDTYWYLTALPQMMAHATRRFAHYHDDNA